MFIIIRARRFWKANPLPRGDVREAKKRPINVFWELKKNLYAFDVKEHKNSVFWGPKKRSSLLTRYPQANNTPRNFELCACMMFIHRKIVMADAVCGMPLDFGLNTSMLYAQGDIVSSLLLCIFVYRLIIVLNVFDYSILQDTTKRQSSIHGRHIYWLS